VNRRPALLVLALVVAAALVGLRLTAGDESTTTASASTAGAPPATGPRLDCVRAPASACGYPDATTTGVPPGTTLMEVPAQATTGPGWQWDPRGWVRVTDDGAMIEGLDVSGAIEVEASDVTIRDTRVVQSGGQFGIALRHTRRVTVENCEVSGVDAGPRRLAVGIKDVYGDAQGTAVRRTEVFHTATGIQLYQGLVEDNYVHDLGLVGADHVNGVMDNGGVARPLVIRHNTILNAHRQTDAIALFQDFGGQSDRTIEDNLLAGGAYTVYGGGDKTPTSKIRILRNRFARAYFPKGGAYGAVTGFLRDGTGNQWQGNVWDDTGLPVPVG
jgi:Right handed beta helix region